MDNMTTPKTLFANNVIKPIIEMCFMGEMRAETKYSFAIKYEQINSGRIYIKYCYLLKLRVSFYHSISSNH